MERSAQANEQKAERLVREAATRKVTFVTAESCTAGALANLLANAPGAGGVLHGGFVVYSKEHKAAALGVSTTVLAEHSAVSCEVAQAMANGALIRSPADIAISITGVLGPEPDEDGNPVGLVYIGLAKRNGFTQVDEAQFGERSKDDMCTAVLERALILLEEGLTTGA
jgi:nicotinamide-nucleotide amidase